MGTKLKWDQTGERFYETGVSKGVLYPQVGGKYEKGVAWNGLTAVTESPSGAESTPLYADNIKYLKEEVNKPKIIRKEIKRAIPKSLGQKLFY